ncbi:MAG: cyclic nucleotide-binding domain-containing protein [Agarilytica sp.]
MEVQAVYKYPQESVDTLLSSVPFYKSIKQADQYQYDLLLRHSKILEFSPGEVILEKGLKEEWLYFLLKGQLEVHAGSPDDQATVVNYITPGEVFGDLAILFDHVRTATVVADSNSKKILVFGTNFQVFGKLEETHTVSLNTKLTYYRNMVHNLRWKLEVYRAAYSDQPFASAHRKIKLYTGPKDTMEELKSLDAQARELAKLLVAWNTAIDRLSITPRSEIDSQSLKAIG